MGAKGLLQVLSQYSMQMSIYQCSKYLHQKLNIPNNQYIIVGIDFYLFGYKFLHHNALIEGFKEQHEFLLKNGMLGVYVIDGTPCKDKLQILLKRDKKRRKYSEKNTKYMDIDSSCECNTDFCDMECESENTDCVINKGKKLTRENVNDVLEFFIKNDIPFIQANGEAEHLIKYLYNEKKIDIAMSEDPDILLNGCEYMMQLKQMGQVNLFILNDILTKIGINRTQAIYTAILTGCDYVKPIIYLKCINALNYIKKYYDIENFLNKFSETGIIINDKSKFENFKNSYINAVNIYLDKYKDEQDNLNINSVEWSKLRKYVSKNKIEPFVDNKNKKIIFNKSGKKESTANWRRLNVDKNKIYNDKNIKKTYTDFSHLLLFETESMI
jgi:hypothetical protein